MSEQYYGSLRVNNGVKRIEVNDQGECIEISANDANFYDRFAEMLRWLNAEEDKISAFEKEQAEKYGSENTTDRLLDEVKRVTTLYKECAERIDMIFGKDTCRKVFGNIVPDEILIGDFLDQITPIISKLAQERGQRFQAKYNRNRKGGKRK